MAVVYYITTHKAYAFELQLVSPHYIALDAWSLSHIVHLEMATYNAGIVLQII